MFRKGRGRKFKANDPKHVAPQWCPRRKPYLSVRIYRFKSARDWYFHTTMQPKRVNNPMPASFRYALAYEGRIKLNVKEVWTKLKEEESRDVLGEELHLYDVVELDDGLESVFLYYEDNGVRIVPLFDTDVARQNKFERP